MISQLTHSPKVSRANAQANAAGYRVRLARRDGQVPREGFPLGYEVTGFGSTFTSHNRSWPLPPEAPASFSPVHKNLPEGFKKSDKTYPWLHSTSQRWRSLKRFCGAVFEERPSARSLFGAPVRRVPPRPLVRPGYGERRLGDGSSRVERVRILVWRVRE